MDIKQIFVNGETYDIKDADARTSIEEIINPEFDDSGTVEGITSFPAFLEKFKSKYNLFQWLRDFKAGAQFIMHSGQIINNCVTDRADLPGSAAQLKVLMDLYNVLNTNLTAPMVTEDILAYALSLPAGFHSVSVATNTVNGIGAAGTGYILRRVGGDIIVAVYGISSGVLNINHYDGSTWLGWLKNVTNSDLNDRIYKNPMNQGVIKLDDGSLLVFASTSIELRDSAGATVWKTTIT